MLEYNPDQEYNCSPKVRCKGFSYLQFLIIHSNQIDNCLELIKKEIESKKLYYNNYIDYKNERGMTALMLVCRNPNRNSSLEIAKLLIENGPNVNLQDKYGFTALMLYCINGSNDLVKLLIENGANVNLKNTDGWTALMCLMVLNNKKNLLELIELLILNGTDINSVDEYGNNSLMIFCQELNVDKCDVDLSLNIVKLLINNNINIDLKNNYGYTAISFCCEKPINKIYLDIIKLLLDNGADINITDNRDRTYLDIVCENLDNEYSIQILKLLIEYNIDIRYSVIANNIKENNEIFESCINNEDFNDIEKLKWINSQIKNNKIFSSMFTLSILKSHHIDIDKIYILSDMSKEKYDYIIELNNKSMIKRVN